MTHKLIISVLLSCILIGFASAELTAVAKDFYNDCGRDCIEMFEGDNLTFQFRIQNLGYENTVVFVEILEGGDFATLESNEYIAPARSTGTAVNVLIRSPDKIPINETRSLKLKFTSDMPPYGGGMVALETGIETGVTIKFVHIPVISGSGAFKLGLIISISVIVISGGLILKIRNG